MGVARVWRWTVSWWAALTLAAAATVLAGAAADCSSSSGDGCAPADSDGLSGGDYAFDLTVDDTAFAPTIVKAENLATVKLSLRNTGTRPHGFEVHCLATPNITGCPVHTCFPDASVIAPLAPDASATVTFIAPNPEGAYTFGSSEPGDTMTGQFILQ
jgi:hypothetical protein